MTAYEMRISDWSSDLCSSDLVARAEGAGVEDQQAVRLHVGQVHLQRRRVHRHQHVELVAGGHDDAGAEIDLEGGHPEGGADRRADLRREVGEGRQVIARQRGGQRELAARSEEHTSELQSLMRNSYAVFCLKKKTTHNDIRNK